MKSHFTSSCISRRDFVAAVFIGVCGGSVRRCDANEDYKHHARCKYRLSVPPRTERLVDSMSSADRRQGDD